MPIETSDVLYGLVSAALGGGAWKAATALLSARATAKKIAVESADIQTKSPLEGNLIAIKGSENAVLIMQEVNQRLVDENLRLREEREAAEAAHVVVVAAKDARITRLEEQLEGVQRQLVDAHDLAARLSIALSTAQDGYDVVRRELTALKQEPDAPGGTS